MRTFLIGLILAFSLPAFAQVPTVSHTLTWNAPTTYADGTALTEALTYNLYQLVATKWTKVQSNINALTFTTQMAGGLESFEVTAVTADGRESAMSALASITVVLPLPAAPTGLTVK
jgi:hypothetical protein